MLTTLAWTLWAAAAAQGTVVLMPVEVEGFGAQAVRRRDEIDGALKDVLGARLKRPPANTMTCEKEACFRTVAEALGADEVALVELRKRESGGFGDLTVRVFDADGQPVLAFTETLQEQGLDVALRRLCTRAFDAPAHAGRVEVRGALDGETVLVDGLPLAGGLDQLSVGAHEVTVVGPDGATRSAQTEVPFDGVVAVDLPAPLREPPGAAAQRPLWPALVALSAAIGGGVLVAAGVGVGLFDLSTALAARDIAANGLPKRTADPAGTDWQEGYGVPADNADTTPTARARWTANTSTLATANETAAYALLGTAAAGLVIAGAGVAGAVLLWPSDAE